MAEDLFPVNLPPIASTGDDAPRHSGRGGNERNNRNKKNRQNEVAEKDNGSSSRKRRENKIPDADVDFEPAEHELDRFA